MAEKDQQVITQEDYENPPTQLLPPRIFLASKEKNRQPTNQPTSNVVGAQPAPCCSFARHLVEKMVIQAAHLLLYIPIYILTLLLRITPPNPTDTTQRKSSTFKAFQRLLNNVIKAERIATCLTGKRPGHPGGFRQKKRKGWEPI